MGHDPLGSFDCPYLAEGKGGVWTRIKKEGVWLLSISYKGSAERVRRPESRYVPLQRHSARGYQRRSPHTRALSSDDGSRRCEGDKKRGTVT